MDLELTPTEVEEFKDALLNAFPFKGDLEQLVFFGLGEYLNQLVADGPYAKIVTDLIIWVNGQGKVEILLTQARKKNPGNSKLRKFEGQIYGDSSPKPVLYPRSSPLTPALRRQLIDVLLTLPITDDFAGRSVLLIGITGNLNRNSGNARLDFDLIIDQLDSLGQLNSGSWPLLLLIDNALEHVKGFKQPEEALKTVRQVLAKAYEVM